MLLTLFPVVIITLIVMLLVRHQLIELGGTEVERMRSEMFKEKQSQLKDYMELALTSIRAVRNDNSLTEA